MEHRPYPCDGLVLAVPDKSLVRSWDGHLECGGPLRSHYVIDVMTEEGHELHLAPELVSGNPQAGDVGHLEWADGRPRGYRGPVFRKPRHP